MIRIFSSRKELLVVNSLGYRTKTSAILVCRFVRNFDHHKISAVSHKIFIAAVDFGGVDKNRLPRTMTIGMHQPCDGNNTRLDNVGKYVPRSDRRDLVDVSNKDQHGTVVK